MRRKLLVIIVSVILCVSCFTGCSDVVSGEPVPYDSLEDLSEAAGFEVLEPVILPDGYVKSGYYCVDGSIAEILYMSGSNEIIYAMTPIKTVKSDISDYDDIYVSQINGRDVELTLKDGYVVFGTVRIDDYTYCIRCTAGLSTGEFEQIARGFGVHPDEVELIQEIIDDYNASEESSDETDSGQQEAGTGTGEPDTETETQDSGTEAGSAPEEEGQVSDGITDAPETSEDDVSQMTVTE